MVEQTSFIAAVVIALSVHGLLNTTLEAFSTPVLTPYDVDTTSLDKS